ncbi:hypothetical protein EJ110_NYTH21803 [Nymphaea thermarum]|nr:hypothetical protein EJ110_NYTH21803 [Nymphaea thermarum]
MTSGALTIPAMRKTKRRQLKSIAAGERDARSVELMKSPKSRVVEETNVDEDSWVIVRKQKIRVFIPPLSVAVTTNHEKSRNKRIQPGVKRRGRPKVQRKDDVSLLEKQTQCGEHQKTSGSNISAGLLSPAKNEQSIVTPAIVAEAPNIVTGSSDGLPSQKDVEQGSNELSSQKNVDLTSHVYHLLEDQLLGDKDKNGDSGNPVNDSQNVVGEPSSTLQPLSEAESARMSQERQDFRPLESVQYPNNCRVQDRNIRALVLEHKLELAGGVNKWLISKGLESSFRTLCLFSSSVSSAATAATASASPACNSSARLDVVLVSPDPVLAAGPSIGVKGVRPGIDSNEKRVVVVVKKTVVMDVFTKNNSVFSFDFSPSTSTSLIAQELLPLRVVGVSLDHIRVDERWYAPAERMRHCHHLPCVPVAENSLSFPSAFPLS